MSTVAGIRHPEITVQLDGTPANAMETAVRVRSALAVAGVNVKELVEFQADIDAVQFMHTASDPEAFHDAILDVVVQWVDVE